MSKTDVRSYVEFWLQKNGVTPNESGFFDGHSLGKKPTELAKLIYLDYKLYRMVEDPHAPKFDRQDFKDALSIMVHENRIARQSARYASLRFEGVENLRPLQAFVRAVFHRDDEVAVAILAHHIATIKRKMARLPAQWHVMPIFSGPQGTGKTIAVKQLYSPLGSAFADMSISTALNLFSQDFVERYSCVLFDEMAGLDKADINALKRLITSDGGLFRKAHDPDMSEFESLCSFVGTTNEAVSLLLKDPTGARRFFELVVQQPTDREALGCKGISEGKIDYVALWKGIDETSPNKYWSPIAERIAEMQEALKAPEVVEEFLRAHQLSPIPGEATTHILFSTLFNIFLDWAKSNNYFVGYNNATFGRRLKALGFEKVSGNVGGKWVTAIKIAASHSLPLAELQMQAQVIERLRNGLKAIALKGEKE